MKKTKNFKKLLIMFVAIITICIGLYSPVQKNASAAVLPDINLFDMQLFNDENYDYKSPTFSTVLIDENGIIVKYTQGETTGDRFYYSGGTYLNAGTYTLSFVYNGADLLDSINIGIYGSGIYGLVSISSNGFHEVTFTITEARSYNLGVFTNNSTLLLNEFEFFSFNDVMLNTGDVALPFKPYNYVEPDATNKDIIAKLEDLLGSESGVIAGASLGTFLVLCLILYLVLTRRKGK